MVLNVLNQYSRGRIRTIKNPDFLLRSLEYIWMYVSQFTFKTQQVEKGGGAWWCSEHSVFHPQHLFLFFFTCILFLYLYLWAFIYDVTYNLYSNPRNSCHPHFTDEEAETQRGEVTRWRSLSSSVVEQGFESGSSYYSQCFAHDNTAGFSLLGLFHSSIIFINDDE